MKAFTKTLLAVALLAAGTGVANASIKGTSGSDANELYFQVYDSSRGLTYDLDLGQTLTTFSTAIANSLSVSYDLSTHDNWNTFVGAGFNAASTKFGVAVSNGTLKAMFTSNNVNPTIGSLSTVAGGILNQVARINNGQPTPLNSALNVDKTVANTDTAGTGQWASVSSGLNNLDNLFGTYGAASAGIAYGSSGDFWFFNNTAKTNIGTWTLAGNSLNFAFNAPVSAVPLPAAVWMFGAGLMGVLRLNRRKSMAA